MITDDGFKLILYPKVPKALLFDLAADPHEQQDLSEVAAHQPRMKVMFSKLSKLQTETGDELDLAMLAVAGMCVQEQVTGQPLLSFLN